MKRGTGKIEVPKVDVQVTCEKTEKYIVKIYLVSSNSTWSSRESGPIFDHWKLNTEENEKTETGFLKGSNDEMVIDGEENKTISVSFDKLKIGSRIASMFIKYLHLSVEIINKHIRSIRSGEKITCVHVCDCEELVSNIISICIC